MAASVKAFFLNYADALLSYSPENISSFYQTPMAVYSDQGVQTVTKDAEVVAFWMQGVKPYQEQNIASTTPEILSEERLSQNIYVAEVAWKSFDSSRKEIANETNFYILTDHDGELKISGLIIMTKAE